MKESAQIALSYVRAHAERLGITDRSILDRHIHIHVPAGAVPKDGPSAGVTMVTGADLNGTQQARYGPMLV